MLHSNLAMTSVKLYPFIFLLCLLFYTSIIVQAQDENQPVVEITLPLQGEAVQGLLQITGTINLEDLKNYTIEFTFQESTDETWFSINRDDTPIIESTLGEWDTSSIPDGNYNLRLTVNRETNDPIILVVEGIRVRNYSPIETNTPAPTSILPTMTPTIIESIADTPTVQIRPSPTPLTPNSAAVTQDDIQKKLIEGAMGGFAIFMIFLIYRSTRNRR
jgi:hypothetical protein